MAYKAKQPFYKPLAANADLFGQQLNTMKGLLKQKTTDVAAKMQPPAVARTPQVAQTPQISRPIQIQTPQIRPAPAPQQSQYNQLFSQMRQQTAPTQTPATMQLQKYAPQPNRQTVGAPQQGTIVPSGAAGALAAARQRLGMAQPRTYKKGGKVKKTGMALVHKGEEVLTKKESVARKMSFKKDEEKGIEEYGKAIRVSKGKEKKTYKEILPDEKKHLRKIKSI